MLAKRESASNTFSIFEKHAKLNFRFIAFLLYLAIGVVIPLWLIENLLDRLEKERSERLEQSARDRAIALMGKLDRGLDRNIQIENALTRLKHKIEKFLQGQSLDANTAGMLTKKYYHVFPSGTILLWFDQNDRLIEPNGQPTPTPRRSWQSLFKVLRSLPGTTDTEKKLANNFIKTTLGDFIEPGFLRRAFYIPLSVLKQGKSHVLRILRLRVGKEKRKTVGWLMVFLPTGHARFGWELQRQVRLLSKGGNEVGGYWQSRQQGIGKDLLNDNLLHGLLLQLERGQGFFRMRDMTCLTRFWSQDPDLVLVAAVPSFLPNFGLQNAYLFSILRWLIRILGGAGAIWAALISAGFLKFSLKAKFQWAMAFLTGFPCLAMGLWGAGHLLQVAQFRESEIKKRLEHQLISVEQSVATTLSRIESELNLLMRTTNFSKINDITALLTTFKPFEKFGLRILLFGRRHQQTLSHTYTQTTRQEFDEQEISIKLARLAKMFFRKAESDLQTKKSPGESTDNEISLLQQADFFHDPPRNKLQFLRFGSVLGYLFFSQILDENKLAQHAVFLIFDFQKLIYQVLKDWIKKPKSQESKVFLRSLDLLGFRHLPKYPPLRETLEVVAYTREPVSQIISHKNRKFIILVRPLAGLETIGMAVMPYSSDVGFLAATRYFIIILAALAFTVAIFGADLLTFLFLQPILQLRRLIDKLERGDLQVRAPIWATDEISNLALAFNAMISGLAQKERMKPFLNRDLIEQVKTAPQVRTELRQVVVFFAGLRDFNSLERQIAAEEAMQIMNTFLGLAEQAINKWNGEIDKFLGDSVLAVFVKKENIPLSYAERAIRAAVDLQQAMKIWNEQRTQSKQPLLRAGVGLAGGFVICGHIGSLHKRLDFTVIGDPVNLAARLEKLAARPQTPNILATADLVADISLSGLKVIPTSIQGVRGRQSSITVVGVEKDGDV